MPTEKKKPTSKKLVKSMKDSGITYISSIGNYYIAPKIDADAIRDLLDNIYIRGLIQKQRHLIFGAKFWLEVLDSDGNQDEEIELDMLAMCEAQDVRLWAKIQMAWVEYFAYGAAIQNQVWDYDPDGVYRLKKLRHLPSHSFRNAPITGDGKIYSQILQGIILDKSGEIEFYQTDDDFNIPTKIDNVILIKDPTSTSLSGESVILPIIPVVNMLKFVWTTQMQQANRTGAKILFIKVTDPQPASTLNGNVSDMDAAKEILEHWGKNTGFPLRGNMEIIDPHISDDSNSLQIIDSLNQLVIDYISPINFLTAANDAARLGGSDNQRMEMILRYIKSIHSWLEDAFEQLLQRYLDANGYDGYKVNIHIPEPEVDSSEIDLQRAQVGVTSKALFPNEIRLLLGEEELDDEKLIELIEYYKSIEPAQPTFGFAASALPVISKTETTDNPVVDESIEELETVGKRLSKGLMAAIENEL